MTEKMLFLFESALRIYNPNSNFIHAFECSIPSCWSYLGRINRCILVRDVSLGVVFMFHKTCTISSNPSLVCVHMCVPHGSISRC